MEGLTIETSTDERCDCLKLAWGCLVVITSRSVSDNESKLTEACHS